MLIEAIFIGKDGSLGYQKHKEYALVLTNTPKRNIVVQRMDRSGTCEYSSVLSFLKNWSNVKEHE